jgi:hypothetical protein
MILALWSAAWAITPEEFEAWHADAEALIAACEAEPEPCRAAPESLAEAFLVRALYAEVYEDRADDASVATARWLAPELTATWAPALTATGDGPLVDWVVDVPTVAPAAVVDVEPPRREPLFVDVAVRLGPMWTPALPSGLFADTSLRAHAGGRVWLGVVELEGWAGDYDVDRISVRGSADDLLPQDWQHGELRVRLGMGGHVDTRGVRLRVVGGLEGAFTGTTIPSLRSIFALPEIVPTPGTSGFGTWLAVHGDVGTTRFRLGYRVDAAVRDHRQRLEYAIDSGPVGPLDPAGFDDDDLAPDDVTAGLELSVRLDAGRGLLLDLGGRGQLVQRFGLPGPQTRVSPFVALHWRSW